MTQATNRPQGGQLLAAISNMVVHVQTEHVGRGPTQARTQIDGDVVHCLLQNNLTKGERSLIAAGKLAVVKDLRHDYQEIMGPDFIAGVQDLTGREVIAFMSSNHVDPDVASEVFLLAPGAEAPRDDDNDRDPVPEGSWR
jgi:uncharacterized protein YbcI